MKIKSQKLKNILQTLHNFLPEKSTILLLSKAGSKTFGLRGDETQEEIYGIFHAENFWEHIVLEKRGLKIEMVELQKFLQEAPYRYGVLCCAHFANPIYIHPKFDYPTLRKLFIFSACFTTPLFKTKGLNFFVLPDKILQLYWDLMVRLHILKTGKCVLNINRLKKYYRFPMIDILQKRAQAKPLTANAKQKIKNDILKMYKELQKFQAKREKVSDFFQKWKQWEEKIRKTFLLSSR